MSSQRGTKTAAQGAETAEPLALMADANKDLQSTSSEVSVLEHEYPRGPQTKPHDLSCFRLAPTRNLK
eukprot:4014978-Pleurochrysis_carterae.AAC.1